MKRAEVALRAHPYRSLFLAASTLVLASAAVGGFLLTRNSEPEAPAHPDSLLVGPPVPQCTAAVSPAGVEHTSCFEGEPPRSGWYVPIMNEEAKKPLFDGEINAIRIGPNVERDAPSCEIGVVPFDETTTSELRILPDDLPDGSERVRTYAQQCGGQVYSTEASYYVPTDLSIPRWGGYIDIARIRGEPAMGFAGVAADRAEAAQIAGRPAVLFQPVTAEGFGTAAIAIREEFGLTFIGANGVAMDDLIAVAESLYR